MTLLAFSAIRRPHGGIISPATKCASSISARQRRLAASSTNFAALAAPAAGDIRHPPRARALPPPLPPRGGLVAAAAAVRRLFSPPRAAEESSSEPKKRRHRRREMISPEREYILCFDGRSRPSSDGASGSGAVLYDDGGAEIWSSACGRMPGGPRSGRYEAGYVGLIAGLRRARSLGMRRISVYGCIELVRKQMEGTFRVKKPSLKGYHDEAMSLRGDFESFRIHCVDKSLNERASQLARKSMDAAVGGGNGGDVLVRSAPPKDGEDGRDGRSRKSPDAPPRLAVGSDHNIMDSESILDGVLGCSAPKDDEDGNDRSRKSPDAPPRLAVGSDHNIMDFESILDGVLGYSAPKDDEDGNDRSRKSPDAPRLTVGSDHIKNSESISPERTYVLRFDGGSRGNPGRAGAGMVLYDGGDGAEVWCGSQYLGECYTNNQAEYRGLITGLRCAMSLGVRNIVVQGDSQLILRQLDGQYKVKSPTLMAYYQEAKSLVPEFASFQTSHIERARNARADELANLAMDNRSSMGFEVKR